MRNTIMAAIFIALTSISFAQESTHFWSTLSKNSKKERTVLENKQQLPTENLLDLNINAIKQYLSNAPTNDFSSKSKESGLILSLPNLDKGFDKFYVFENSILTPENQKLYPELRSYIGYGVDNPNNVTFFCLTPLGLDATTNLGINTVKISSLAISKNTYTVYNTNELLIENSEATGGDFCGTKNMNTIKKESERANFFIENANDNTLRKFRVVLAATAEFCTKFTATYAGTGGFPNVTAKKNAILAHMANYITEINSIYLKSFAVQLIFMPNPNIIFTTAANDPFPTPTATNASLILSKIQPMMDNPVYGVGQYEIGHLLGSGPGIAGIAERNVAGKPNRSPNVGRASGLSGPKYGFATFARGTLAHEFAHQLGAGHTYTYLSPEFGDDSYEPGSGSTIMGYAGTNDAIAANKSLQATASDYFHASSIKAIMQYITRDEVTKFSSQPITNSNIPANHFGNFSIPPETAFAFNGYSDYDYTYEQMDLGNTTNTLPNKTHTSGPMFRSLIYPPNTNPNYHSSDLTIPDLKVLTKPSTADIYANPKWQVLPAVARTMNFRYTARGAYGNNGNNLTVNVINPTVAEANGTGTGPFKLTYPNAAGLSFKGGSTITVTWDPGCSKSPQISCLYVEIGFKIDDVAAYSTYRKLNTGSATIQVPNIAGSNYRIMISGHPHDQQLYPINNITSPHSFFDISTNKFKITYNPSAKMNEDDSNINLNQKSISLYPNPSQGEFNMNIDNVSGKQIEVNIFDIFGKNVFTTKFVSEKEVVNKAIDIKQFASGLYIVEINIDGTVHKERIIKQ